MERIALVRNGAQFLVSQLKDGIEKSLMNACVDEYSFAINDLSNMDENTRLIFVFIDGESITNQSSLIYIKDIAIEREIPLVFCAYSNEQDQIREAVSGASIARIYLHPINVKEIIGDLDLILKFDTSTDKKKILIVDDDGMYCKYIRGILEGKYMVLYETSGLKAITRMAQIRPDLILLDYEMPKLNGLVLFDCIKDEENLRDIPIAFLTGKNDAETVRAVVALNPEAYILKSSTPEQIMGEVDNIFARRKVLSMDGSTMDSEEKFMKNLFEVAGII